MRVTTPRFPSPVGRRHAVTSAAVLEGPDTTGTLTAGDTTVITVRTCDGVYEVINAGSGPTGEFSCDGRVVNVRDYTDLRYALETGVAAGRGEIVPTDTGWAPRGDPTDVALAVVAMKAGIERATVTRGMPEIHCIPFSSDRQLTAIFHRSTSSGRTTAFVKGAPDRVLDLCWSAFACGASRPLDVPTRRALGQASAEMARRGLRVLALASGDVCHADERSLLGLTFVALVGISDPPVAAVRGEGPVRRL
jgi:magnesium-transporting ATPase (P-type)